MIQSFDYISFCYIEKLQKNYRERSQSFSIIFENLKFGWEKLIQPIYTEYNGVDIIMFFNMNNLAGKGIFIFIFKFLFKPDNLDEIY